MELFGEEKIYVRIPKSKSRSINRLAPYGSTERSIQEGPIVQVQSDEQAMNWTVTGWHGTCKVIFTGRTRAEAMGKYQQWNDGTKYTQHEPEYT